MAHASNRPTGCDVGCPLLGVAGPAVDRRTFLSHAALAAAYASAAAALAACGAGGGGDPTSPTSIGSSIKVSDYAGLATVGGVATMTLNGTPIAVVRTGASSFLALSRICPHQRFTIDPVSGGFYCPGHGAQFSSTGQWTGGQPTSSMQAYPTTYDASTGTLHIG